MIHDAVDPVAERAIAEKRELMRLCAVRTVSNWQTGRSVDPHSLAWARQFIATTPKLRGALGTGGPIAPARAFAGPNVRGEA